MGGTGALVRGMVELHRGAGRRGALGARRARDRASRAGARSGVRLADGRGVAADVVVSQRRLRRGPTGTSWRPSTGRRWTERRLDRSALLDEPLRLVLRHRPAVRRRRATTRSCSGRATEELLDDIFDRKVLADDFSLYLHRPTATDPSLAPDGCDAFYVLSPVPHLDSGIDWASRREPYRQKIARYLERDRAAGPRGRTWSTSRVLTPQGFRDDCLSLKGAAFGLEPVLHQSAWFRPHNRSEDVEGLYLVGAGTHPGAGMPGVLSSARVLDTVVPDPVRR